MIAESAPRRPPSGPTSRRRRELTLAGQALALQLVVVAVLLAIVGAISLRQSTASFTAERGGQMRSVAEYLGSLEVVRQQLTESRADRVAASDTRRVLAPSVDRALQLSGASEVLLASPDGTVVAASDPAQVGTRATLGDSDVRRGRGWGGDVEVAGQRAVAGHAPVIADDGTLVGLALAEQDYPSVWERLTGSATDLLLFLGLGALLGGVGTYGVSRVVKRRSHGLAPTEIAGLAEHRAALLHSIREGVLAVDPDGRVSMMNDAARELLDVPHDPVGRAVADLGLDPHVVDLLVPPDPVLGEAGEVRDATALVGTRVLVFNRRAASSRGRGIGSVTTMRDRTELAAVQSQLSTNLSLTDTLRAQTHEFTNQLHTIAGLVELEEYDEVAGLVGTLTRRRAVVSERVTERVSDPAVAALLIAKDSAAQERGVRLVLEGYDAAEPPLPALDPETSADLTTVVGNLVDNAIDAAASAHPPTNPPTHSAGSGGRTVAVRVGSSEGEVRVRVADSGAGVPADLREAVFVRGFSTKPEVLGGRGIGLPLVRLICTQRGGRVTAGDDPELGGAVFEVVLPRDPGVSGRPGGGAVR